MSRSKLIPINQQTLKIWILKPLMKKLQLKIRQKILKTKATSGKALQRKRAKFCLLGSIIPMV